MFTLKSPCPDCPFRNDRRPYLRPGRAEQIGRDLAFYGEAFPCHKTLDYDREDEDGQPGTTDKTAQCAGAMILLTKIGAPSQIMLVGARFGWFDARELDLGAPVYDTMEAFVRANGGDPAEIHRRKEEARRRPKEDEEWQA
jgi:hypothetical protein